MRLEMIPHEGRMQRRRSLALLPEMDSSRDASSSLIAIMKTVC
jgi:hypothetical protein